MKSKILQFGLYLLLMVSSSVSNGVTLNYTITGTGSGALGGQSFSDAAFTISMIGNTDLFNDQINPLVSSSITIDGLGTTTINESSRLGLNSYNIVYFSRSTGLDFFDFYLAGPVDLTQPFAPVVGTNVFALHQFIDVPSTLGLLTFNSSSDVLFQASLVPVPAAFWLFLSGIAGFQCFRRRYLGTANP